MSDRRDTFKGIAAVEAMTPDRWKQVRAIFDQAVELPVTERLRFVERVLGDQPTLRSEVISLLQVLEPSDAFLDPRAWWNLEQDTDDRPSQHLIGRRIGVYVLLEEIGRGGMGSVFLARREDGVDQRVAIKILHALLTSRDASQRFQSEQRILGQMQHPFIATLIDVGSTADGLLYYVMEFIEGRPIDEHSNAQSLPIHERITLFRLVCSAVHFAHQRLVVHRAVRRWRQYRLPATAEAER
jgi:serine/threonine protein kinase